MSGTGGSVAYIPACGRVHVSSTLIPLLDPSKWQAMSFVWRSPLGQSIAFPEAPLGELAPWAVRAVPDWDALPLLEVAARQGFWGLQLPFLKKLGNLIGAPLPKEADLVATIEVLCQKIVGTMGENDFIAWLDRRIACMTESDNMRGLEEKILDTDDAQDCLVSHDKADFQRTKQERASSSKDAAVFVAKLKQTRQAAIARVAAEKETAQEKKRKKRQQKPPARIVVPPGAITQADAKAMSPEGSYIWRNSSSQSWHGKMPPLGGETSRSWAKDGHREAALMVLRDLWTKSMALGKCTACTVQGLFPEEAPSTGGASSSSRARS